MNFKSHEFTFAVIINSLKTLRTVFKEKTMMSSQKPHKCLTVQELKENVPNKTMRNTPK